MTAFAGAPCGAALLANLVAVLVWAATAWLLYLVAAERWPGMLTIVSPVLMTCLLAFGTGKRLLERTMAERPGYAEYQRRTSGFVPLPPRKQVR